MSCCRGRGLAQTTGPVWPSLPAASYQLPQSQVTMGPCWYVETQGEFLSLRVSGDVLYLLAGAEPHEALGALRACQTPRGIAALALIERAYAFNVPSRIVSMVQDRIFTLSFLRTQVGT